MAWWIKHEQTDRAALTKMRQLCLCTASTLDLVVKLVDITHSAHTWLQHASVARLVIRWASIYISGKCSAWFLQMNAAFPFNCLLQRGCSCPSCLCGVGVCAIALINNKTEGSQKLTQLVFVRKRCLSRAVKQSCWCFMECKYSSAASKCSQSSQWFSHLFTVIILISQI